MSLKNYEGKTLKFETPSGYNFTIREQNGDDDEILTQIDGEADEEAMIENINRFVLGIIVEHDIHENHLTLEDVVKLKNRDKHHTLLKSRIHSLGSSISFKIKCSNPKCKSNKTGDGKHQYTEDLSKYDNDFKPRKEGDPQPYKFQVQKYESGKEVQKELTLSSGKKLKYDLFTGETERLILAMQEGMISANTQYLARRLHILDGTVWQRVSAFGIFSPRDMAELRQSVDKDKQFVLAAECICPDCSNEMLIPFTQIKDFFFPSEITNM